MNRKKILIVEDDRDLVNSLSIRLRANHYDTVAAYDGDCAVDVARREMPDLILLDLGLPGCDGYAVMTNMKAFAELAGIPVIILTAREKMRDKLRAMDSGALYFIEKPFDNEDLLAVISSALFGLATKR